MIKVSNLTKKYNHHFENEVTALNNINCEIEFSKWTTIVGASGSGKTTFLRCISGLDKITSGDIRIDDQSLSDMNSKELNEFKRKKIAFIFQNYNLIDDLTILENICLKYKCSDEIVLLADKWNIKHILNHFPYQCSGGQQQKAAILRAIQRKSKILFCDEPTGALDSSSAKEVLKVLEIMKNTYGTTIIMVTHNNLISQISDRVLEFKDGIIKKDFLNNCPLSVEEVRS
jgi:putative ABC transport system ATP-binding protein